MSEAPSIVTSFDAYKCTRCDHDIKVLNNEPYVFIKRFLEKGIGPSYRLCDKCARDTFSVIENIVTQGESTP